MRIVEVPGPRGLLSLHHRKADLRGSRVDVFALALRLVSVALLSADGWAHLHLWQDGYRHISTIGPLFLTGAVSALVIAAVLLVRPSRLIALPASGWLWASWPA